MNETRQTALGYFAISLGVLANLAVIASSYWLFQIEPGTAIRPMGWALMVFIIALCSIVIVPSAAFAARRHRCAPWQFRSSIVLSLTPFIVGHVMLRITAAVVGFSLKP